jgi:5-oxoprolinase (ATP-hydrolysing)
LIDSAGAVNELPGCFSITVRPGDVIEIETPGGGAFGRADEGVADRTDPHEP